MLTRGARRIHAGHSLPATTPAVVPVKRTIAQAEESDSDGGGGSNAEASRSAAKKPRVAPQQAAPMPRVWPTVKTAYTKRSPSPHSKKLAVVSTSAYLSGGSTLASPFSLQLLDAELQAYAQRVADIVQTHYAAAADRRVAEGAQKYMRNLFPFFGLSAPLRKQINTRIFAKLQEADLGTPGLDAAAACARLLCSRSEREYQYFGIRFLEKYLVSVEAKNHASVASDAVATADHKRMLELVREVALVRPWWDTIDDISVSLVGRLVLCNRDALEPVMREWIRDQSIWVQRMALLHQLHYKTKTNEDLLFEFVLLRHDEPDFFIQKASGWALRQYARAAPGAVRAFLKDHKHMLPLLTYKEASKHL